MRRGGSLAHGGGLLLLREMVPVDDVVVGRQLEIPVERIPSCWLNGRHPGWFAGSYLAADEGGPSCDVGRRFASLWPCPPTGQGRLDAGRGRC